VTEHDGYTVLLGIDNIGKEEILIALAKKFGSKARTLSRSFVSAKVRARVSE
jgi:hypothetical protein